MCEICAMSRRRFLRGFATGAAATLAAGALGGGALFAATPARAAEPVALGAGRYRYQVVEGWGELPPGVTYGDSAAVCVDSSDNVYVFTRGTHPVIVFDRNGKFLRVEQPCPAVRLVRHSGQEPAGGDRRAGAGDGGHAHARRAQSRPTRFHRVQQG